MLTQDTNLDLEPGVQGVTAWLYEVGTLVDTQNSCITIEYSNQSAEIVYAVVNEQFGTFDHKVTIKSGSLQAGESYVLDWELVDGNQNVIENSGTDSWTATQSTRYTHDTNLDLAEGTSCVTAWLYEDGVLIDTANGCITIECDQNNSGGNSGGNSSGNYQTPALVMVQIQALVTAPLATEAETVSTGNNDLLRYKWQRINWFWQRYWWRIR